MFWGIDPLPSPLWILGARQKQTAMNFNWNEAFFQLSGPSFFPGTTSNYFNGFHIFSLILQSERDAKVPSKTKNAVILFLPMVASY